MTPYKKLNKDSGVVAYKLGKDYIAVQFSEGDIYIYTYASTGTNKVEIMKKLAEEGAGLSTFISQYVRGQYAKRVEGDLVKIF